MDATLITVQLVLAYLSTHVVLIPVRVVKKLRKQPANIGYPIFIPVFLIIFMGWFLYLTRDINFSYFPWVDIGFGLLFLLAIAGVATYLLTLVIRVIKKLFGKGMKLSTSAYEAAFFLVLLLITMFSIPMNPETPRMMLTEALSLGNAYKVSITDFYEENHRYPENSDLKTYGLPIKGKYVQDIMVGDNGRVVAIMKPGMYKSISGKTFILTPHDAGKTWDCGGPDIPDRYLPGICRKHK
jgi:hypothetical protein